jgi:hypothetical protein
MKRLREINWGQKDANIEYFSSRRTGTDPVFVSAFLQRDVDMMQHLNNGTHFLLEGLKGAGKTTIMRYLQFSNPDQLSDFIIFKDTILEESDLHDFADGLLIDPEILAKSNHVQHIMRRIITMLFARMIIKDVGVPNIIEENDDTGFITSLFEKIKKGQIGLIAQLAFDTASAAIQASTIKGLTKDAAVFDAAKALKRQNDSILSTLISNLKNRKSKPIRLYIDEIQYGYSDHKTKRQEAILVRDTILAANSINRSFADAGVDAIVIIAVRTEFLMHPAMAVANISQIVSAAGLMLSWETDNFNDRHPIFELAARRVNASSGTTGMTGPEFCKKFIPNEDIHRFLECMWSQPRDIVRFFDLASKHFGVKYSLGASDVDFIFRKFSRESWEEIKSSISATFSENSIIQLEKVLRIIGPRVFDNTLKLGYAEAVKFCDTIAKTINLDTGEKITGESLFQFLYTIGIFYTKHVDKNGREIFYRHWRGNKFPHKDGLVMLHRSIARAFS